MLQKVLADSISAGTTSAHSQTSLLYSVLFVEACVVFRPLYFLMFLIDVIEGTRKKGETTR